MADRMMLSFEVNEALGNYVAELLRERRYESLGEYMRDLIRRDQEAVMDDLSEERLQKLREAFAAPEGDYVEADAETFLTAMRQRRNSCAA